jgi:hypothetical protein
MIGIAQIFILAFLSISLNRQTWLSQNFEATAILPENLTIEVHA